MNYIELNCRVFPAEPATDILIAQLAEKGYESFQESDTGFLAYIPKNIFNAEDLQDIEIVKSDAFDISFTYKEIVEENWNAVWESNYDPVLIADKCYVRAPFHPENTTAAYEIIVEPKMSFGTAHHETTSLVVETMLNLDFNGKRVLDMGTGTGVLAILAEKCGATQITAIDNDEWAYENAVENFSRNLTKNAVAVLGDAQAIPKEPSDIIIANINRNILLHDMKAYAENLKQGGIMVLSGFYKHDISTIMQEAAKYGIIEMSHIEKNDWVAVCTTKK